MSGIFDLFKRIGTEFSGLFNEPLALYAIYFAAFFIGTFALYRVLLQRVPHLKGKPANVIAFMVTVISVGAIFYKRSAAELIGMFNGFVVFLILLFFAAIIIGVGIFYGKKFENKFVKWLIISLSLWLGISILLPAFVGYWIMDTTVDMRIDLASDSYRVEIERITTEAGNSVSETIAEILYWIKEVSFAVFLITGIVYIFSLLGGGIKDVRNGSEEKNPGIGELRQMLEKVNSEVDKIDNYFKGINGFLKSKRVK